MKLRYISLRWQIFRHEVKCLMTQIENLAIGLIAFLGVAIPALIYLVLLGLGIILEHPDDADKAISTSFNMLAIQTLIIFLFRAAINAENYQSFIKTLGLGKVHHHFVDLVLMMLCMPLLFLLAAIIFSVPIAGWRELPHGFALLSQFLCFALVALYFPTRMLGLLLFNLLLTLFPLSLLQYYLGTHLSLFLLLMNRPFPVVKSPKLPFLLRYWWQFAISQKTVLINCLLSFITIASTVGSLRGELIEYANFVYLIGLMLILLLASCTQISVNRHLNEYAHFYEAHLDSKLIRLGVFVFPLGLLFVGLMSLVLLNGFSSTFIAVFVGCPLLFWMARKYESRLMITWIALSICFLVSMIQL